jgi:hypothetical protein
VTLLTRLISDCYVLLSSGTVIGRNNPLDYNNEQIRDLINEVTVRYIDRNYWNIMEYLFRLFELSEYHPINLDNSAYWGLLEFLGARYPSWLRAGSDAEYARHIILSRRKSNNISQCLGIQIPNAKLFDNEYSDKLLVADDYVLDGKKILGSDDRITNYLNRFLPISELNFPYVDISGKALFLAFQKESFHYFDIITNDGKTLVNPINNTNLSSFSIVGGSITGPGISGILVKKNPIFLLIAANDDQEFYDITNQEYAKISKKNPKYEVQVVDNQYLLSVPITEGVLTPESLKDLDTSDIYITSGGGTQEYVDDKLPWLRANYGVNKDGDLRGLSGTPSFFNAVINGIPSSAQYIYFGEGTDEYLDLINC